MPEQELTIPGYEPQEGGRILDANDLLEWPGFWSVYLRGFGGSESAVAAAFPADRAGRAALEQVLSDQHRWPVLSLRLVPARGRLSRWLRIAYRNFPDDLGRDVLVTSDLGGAAITIASEGHFSGPGVCWEELQALAAMPDPTLTGAQRFVLALPLLGDAGLPANAQAVVAEALGSIGAVGDTDALAGEFLDTNDHLQWQIRQGVRMCLARHAVRHVQDLSLNELREVDLAFGGRYYRSPSGRREYRPRVAGRAMPRWRFEVVDSRVAAGVGLRLLGRLDGEIRDGEPARLVDGDSTVPIAAIHLDFEDTATRQLVITINDTHITPPASGASLHPVDA